MEHPRGFWSVGWQFEYIWDGAGVLCEYQWNVCRNGIDVKCKCLLAMCTYLCTVWKSCFYCTCCHYTCAICTLPIICCEPHCDGWANRTHQKWALRHHFVFIMSCHQGHAVIGSSCMWSSPFILHNYAGMCIAARDYLNSREGGVAKWLEWSSLEVHASLTLCSEGTKFAPRPGPKKRGVFFWVFFWGFSETWYPGTLGYKRHVKKYMAVSSQCSMTA